MPKKICHNKSVSIYEFMRHVKPMAPKGPIPASFGDAAVRCGDYTQISSQNWLVPMERSQAFRDVYTLPFGKNYVCFFGVCACVTKRWNDPADSSERSFSSSPLHAPKTHSYVMTEYVCAAL